MPWKLHLLSEEEMRLRRVGDSLKPGDCWWATWLEGYPLSPEYLADWKGKRPPLVVHLPDKSDWLVDGVASNLNGHGWKVTGEFPLITATPSIGKYNAHKTGWTYHGWLKGGELSDDIEGKTYF